MAPADDDFDAFHSVAHSTSLVNVRVIVGALSSVEPEDEDVNSGVLESKKRKAVPAQSLDTPSEPHQKKRKDNSGSVVESEAPRTSAPRINTLPAQETPGSSADGTLPVAAVVSPQPLAAPVSEKTQEVAPGARSVNSTSLTGKRRKKANPSTLGDLPKVASTALPRQLLAGTTAKGKPKESSKQSISVAKLPTAGGEDSALGESPPSLAQAVLDLSTSENQTDPEGLPSADVENVALSMQPAAEAGGWLTLHSRPGLFSLCSLCHSGSGDTGNTRKDRKYVDSGLLSISPCDITFSSNTT